MPASAQALRLQIETALADRIPAALTPARQPQRPRQPTGIAAVDAMLEGGLPVGAITEIVGAECSGRTSLALAFVAQVIGGGNVAAWIDLNDALDPESAAACGVDLSRLLWVRCGVAAGAKNFAAARAARATQVSLPEKYFAPPPVKKGLHGGGCGSHPRLEARGMSRAVGDLLHGFSAAGANLRPAQYPRKNFGALPPGDRAHSQLQIWQSPNPWSRMDQALRATDLLLQGGGFRAIVLDMASIAPEHVSRVPLATWFRYRAAAERTQSSFLLLTQHPCAKSSAGLVLRMEASGRTAEKTVFTGLRAHAEIVRDRFAGAPHVSTLRHASESNVIPLRKPVQSERGVAWNNIPAWQGPRSAEGA